MSFPIDIVERVEDLMDDLLEIVKKELNDQGYKNTNLAKKLRVEVIKTPLGVIGRLWLEDYYVFLEYGMKAGRVPYSPGSGASSSKMINALIRFFKRKGVSDARGAAFATANTWLKEGRPTRASYRFSSNGRRTGFLKQSSKMFTEGLNTKLEDILIDATNDYIVALIRTNRQFKIAF